MPALDHYFAFGR